MSTVQRLANYAPLVPAGERNSRELEEAHEEDPPMPARKLGCALDLIIDWWQLTTDPRFLRSTASRRHTMWCLCMLFSCCLTFYNTFYGFAGFPGSSKGAAVVFYLHVLLVSATLLLRMMPASLILFDYTFALLSALCCGSLAAATTDLQDAFSTSYNVFLVLFLTSGMHSSSCAAFALISLACAAWEGLTHASLLIATVMGVGVVAYTAVVDYNIAGLVTQQLSDQMALAWLREHATDGHCKVDASTGLVISSSRALDQIMLNEGQLRNISLANFLVREEDQKALQGLLVDATAGKNQKPISVSLTAPGSRQFHAKVIPYTATACDVSICFQFVGDRSDTSKLDPGRGQAPKFLLPASAAEHSEIFSGLDSLGYSQDSSYKPVSKTSETAHGVLPGKCNAETQTDNAETAAPKAKAVASKSRPPAFHDVDLKKRSRYNKKFKVTPRHTVHQMTLQLLTRINPQGKGCCFKHISLLTLHQSMKRAMADGCDTMMKPGCAWQCQECLAVHSDDENDSTDHDADYKEYMLCDVCGNSRSGLIFHGDAPLGDGELSDHSSAPADDEETSKESQDTFA